MAKIIIFLVVIMMEAILAGEKIDNIYLEKLDNGTTVLIKERQDTQAVSVQVWFGIGSIYEGEKEKGISHFLEHMLFNGTKHTAPGEIEAEIEKKGGYINAATSFDFTYYYINIAAPFWEEALTYLYWMTTEPLLSDEMVEKEKPIVLEELNRHLDNPKSYLWDTFYSLAYKKSNYKHPVIGYRHTIENFTGQMVRDYFYRHYVPSVMTVVVVGNVKTEEVLKKIKQTFGTVKREKFIPPPVPLEPPQKEVRKKQLKKKQVTRAYVAVGWQAPPAKSKESFTANVLEEILAGGRTSITYQEIREKGLAQAIYGGYMSHKGTSQFLFYFVTEPQKVEKVKEKLFEIIKNYRKNGVPQELVEKAKKRIINREIFSREEVDNDAESAGYASAVMNDIKYDIEYTKNIAKVTKEDIDRFIKNYLKDNNYTQVELLPEE